MLFVWIIVWLAIAIAAWVGFWVLVTFIVGKTRRQGEFLLGRLPAEAPDGFYRGSAYLLGSGGVPWLGKAFERESSKGFNIFTPKGASLLRLMTPFYDRFRVNAEGNTDAYYFRTSAGPAFRDRGIETIKLDYDSPENPFLIRIILDEIVEVAPNQILGKVHVKVFPGYYATVGFFGLRK